MIHDTKIYISIINRVLDEEKVERNSLQIVENPYIYASDRGGNNLRQDMIGYTFTDNFTKKKVILIKELIDDNDYQHVIQRVSYPLDRGKKTFLSNPEKFIEHLVRHEIEHFKYNLRQDEENTADMNAFAKMGFKETATGF
jgi:hypothetical protein